VTSPQRSPSRATRVHTCARTSHASHRATTSLATLLACLTLALGCDRTTSASTPLTVEILGVSGELGWVVCSDRALSECTARTYFRRTTRAHAPTDVDAARDCASLEAHARTTCRTPVGSVPSAEAGRCLARHGVFLDASAHHEPAPTEHRSARFELTCAEGRAHVDVIEPI